MNKIKNSIINSMFGILTLTIVILLYKTIFIATIALIILAIINLSIWKSKIMLKLFIFGSLFGTLAEIIAIYFGVWDYALSNLINIPLWLIPLWGCAAMFIYRIGIDFRGQNQ